MRKTISISNKIHKNSRTGSWQKENMCVCCFCLSFVGRGVTYNVRLAQPNVQRHVVANCNHFSIIQQLAHDESNSNATMQLLQTFLALNAAPKAAPLV